MSLSTRVAVVTGSNKGIGYGIARNLCEKFNGLVYVTSRDKGRGMAAVESLNQIGLKPEFHQLDVNSDHSVNEFAKFLKEKHGGIDVLVNNAAIAFKNDATEPMWQQAEETISTNYFGLLRVCNALFPLLRPHARVVNMSSSAGHLKRIPSEELRKRFSDPQVTVQQVSDLMNEFITATKAGDHVAKGWPDSTYVVSKVGVSALTRIQHRHFLEDSREDIVINHVHPGYVNTDMTSHRGPLTIEQGADAASWLALLPECVDSPNGEYIWFTREVIDWINGPTGPTAVQYLESLSSSAVANG